MANTRNQIRFYRGDFYPKTLIFTDRKTGLPVDLTGMVLTLTVNSEENPTTTENELFKIGGEMVSAVDGKVSFTPTAEDTNIDKSRNYYDVSAVVGTESKRTLVKGEFYIDMDIGKD